MSLGFNTMRAPRMTNLPGAVGANVIVSMGSARRPARPRGTSTVSKVQVLRQSSPTESRSDVRSSPDASVVHEDADVVDDRHFVFASVRHGLLDAESDEEVHPDGTRVCMVYPMRKESNEKVSMRVKNTNKTTGQLSYKWVTVFDPTSEERFLVNFSSIP